MLNVKVPGKLILGGEWGILEKNNLCIIFPINKYLTAQIEHQKDSCSFSSKDINLNKIRFVFDKKKLVLKTTLSHKDDESFFLIQNSIDTTLKYLQEKNFFLKNFNIKIKSQISKIILPDGKKEKIGLGSSSATIVAIISAILKLHGFNIKSTKNQILLFKLSVIANYLTQKKVGSGADIAACVYKKPIIYKRFDQDFLEKNLNENNLENLIKQKWPYLKIKTIKIPKKLILNACYVGYGASTTTLIDNIKKFKKKNLSEYHKTIYQINLVVKKLASLLQKRLTFKIQANILDLINQNRILLKNLSPILETKELSSAIEIANSDGAAAKFSGAGGGDCAISICFDKEISQKIITDWEKKSLYPLNLKILR